MFAWLRRLFAPAPPVRDAVEILERPASFFTSDVVPMDAGTRAKVHEAVQARLPVPTFTHVDRTGAKVTAGVGMDNNSGDPSASAKYAFALGSSYVPDSQLLWYASQAFIGFQTCAILAQHWLVDKACSVPARDAIRNGYKITINGGQGVDAPTVIERLRIIDKRMALRRHCVELVKFSRVFGIRIALFKVDSPDPLYYERPFNPDGITPGSYRGIVQVDPYWAIPELTLSGASNPGSPEFYDPTFWTINGKRYHKSHLVIVRGPEVADILKPSYQYAGISVPQRIYERVYAAERTANEAPQLALTKRAMIFYTDTAAALANEAAFVGKLEKWAAYRDNYGVKVADKEGDKIEQHDTTLSDFDALVMTQYQLVAAIANVPATKLLGTTPKGFNATGEYEEANYHEELEAIQVNDMEALVSRHHLLAMRSEVAPSLGIQPVATVIEWNPADSPTAEEQAKVNKLKAETDKALVDAGALDGQDVRSRIVADPSSGYNGLAVAVPEDAHRAEPGAAMAGGGKDAAETLDGSEWDAVTGQFAEATLITNQSYLDEAIVAAKIAEQDYAVQVSPEFVNPAGQRFRVVIDGHHSLAAAIRAGVCPVFLQSDYTGSDYVNAVTRAEAFPEPASVA